MNFRRKVAIERTIKDIKEITYIALVVLGAIFCLWWIAMNIILLISRIELIPLMIIGDIIITYLFRYDQAKIIGDKR